MEPEEGTSVPPGLLKFTYMQDRHMDSNAYPSIEREGSL